MRTKTYATIGFVCAALLVVGQLAITGTGGKKALPELQDGDLVFQVIAGGQSDAIATATRCKWTHVGMALKDEGGWMVYEAVGPVKRTPLSAWVAQGNGHYFVKRVKDDERLDPDAGRKLRAATEPYMGRAYDLQFRWSDDKIYCSELVWKVYEKALGVRLCEPRALKEWHLNNDLVQRTMVERYGSSPPLDEPMVAPATLFNCALLTTVLER